MTDAELLRLVRPEVRRARAYHVGSAPNVSVKLNQNESPYDLPEELKEELIRGFMDIPANRYPTEQPTILARAFAERMGVSEECVLVGNGSNELTYTLGLTFLSANAPVVLPRPMFALYESMARLYGASVVPVAPLPSLQFDVDGILAAQERTNARLTVVTTPNNPTGHAMSVADLERIVAAAPGIVLVDEAYVEFNPHGSVSSWFGRFPNLLVMRTLSKGFGLAGLRIGYLAGNRAVIAEMLKARLPFMVDRLTQHVALAVLNRPELVKERVASMVVETARLTTALRALESVEVIPSSTNFVLFRAPIEAADLLDRMARRGVLVRNMSGYPELKGFLRVTAGTPDENRAFMAALQSALAEPG